MKPEIDFACCYRSSFSYWTLRDPLLKGFQWKRWGGGPRSVAKFVNLRLNINRIQDSIWAYTNYYNMPHWAEGKFRSTRHRSI